VFAVYYNLCCSSILISRKRAQTFVMLNLRHRILEHKLQAWRKLCTVNRPTCTWSELVCYFQPYRRLFFASLYMSRRLSHSSGVFLRFLLILHRTHVLSFPCFCLQLAWGRGWRHHQRTDWLEPQKPRPISRCEWTLLIHTGKSAEVLHSGILSGVFLVSGACSIRYQLFLPADKSADLSRQ